MASFAQLNHKNIVEKVIKVSDNDAPNEAAGIEFCKKLFGPNETWKQTSYNTKGGIHLDGGTPFRKNYAGIGYKYDEDKDAFIPPCKYASWILNSETCLWEAPVAKPDDGNKYEWNEETTSWDLVSE